MQINSHYPRARADCRQKSDTPLVRPQSHALHLDGLRASLDPLLVDLASQYLGPLWLPASFTLNAFAQICAKVRKWGFRNVSRVRAREAMRPFLNNGTTFTTCKPIAPQRPRPSEQSPKPPRIARAKNELGARSRAKPASLLTRPSLARACARGLSYADFAEAIKRGTRARARAD